jgi:hypothetical protein
VIKIARAHLPEPTTAQLARRTDEVAGTAVPQQVSTAKNLWKSRSFREHVYPELRRALHDMAPGLLRCMFCGDSEGTTVDHFEPVAHAPLRTFDWLNHLLACSKCNSEFKRDRFPRAEDGSPLLVDPTSDDPADHLHLVLAVGEYRALTDRGGATIDVLDLNRAVLVSGRRRVYWTTTKCLTAFHSAMEAGAVQDEEELRQMLWEQPLGDVIAAMLRQAEAPGARDIFADDLHTLALLRNPKLRAVLQDG